MLSTRLYFTSIDQRPSDEIRLARQASKASLARNGVCSFVSEI